MIDQDRPGLATLYNSGKDTRMQIVALIVTHTDWVCRVARVLYLFYYFDMVATIVLLRVVVSDYTYQDIKDCGRILLG